MAWNGSNGAVKRSGGQGPARPTKRGKMPRLPWFTLVIVVVGVVAFFLMRGGEYKKPAPDKKLPALPKKTTAIKHAKPSPVHKVPEVKAERKKESELDKIRAQVKNMNEDERLAFAEQVLAKRPIDLEPKTNRPFMTSVELQMARIFMKELGDTPPPPMPPISPHEYVHLTEILMADNPILPTDSDEWKEAKAIVEVAKKEMRKYIKEGGDPDNFISYYYGLLADAYNERMMSTRELMKAAVAEPEIASELYRRYNERLISKGIKKIELPQHIKEKYSIED